MSVTTLSDIKGLATEVRAKLEAEGIKNTTQFLERTQTQKQRTELAHKVGATPEAMKEMANRADLMRLNGIGGDFSNLLEEAGCNLTRVVAPIGVDGGVFFAREAFASSLCCYTEQSQLKAWLQDALEPGFFCLPIRVI